MANHPDFIPFTDSDIASRLTREHKAILYVIRTLNSLVDKGLLAGGNLQLGEGAERHLEGFEPTEQEILFAMAALKQEGRI